MIPSADFRPWTKRARIDNGHSVDHWRAYIELDDPDAAELRKQFGTYASRERKRVEARRVTLDETPSTFLVRPRRPKGSFVNAPRRVLWSASRYWTYCHALPRGEGRDPISRKAMQAALSLSDEDAARNMPFVHIDVCKRLARNAALGYYPRAGVPWEMAEAIGVEPVMRWRREMTPEPPEAVQSFMDPTHEGLGLSGWYYQNKRGQRAVYGWTADFYAEGTLQVAQAKVKRAEGSPEDYRNKLLSIFD